MKNLLKGLLIRLDGNSKQTLGVLQLFNGLDKIFECKTLELPNKNNQKEVSCIPIGTYIVVPFNSPSKGKCFLLKDVPNRSMIEIHKGNFYTDILGCILVGSKFTDINNDGLLDVVSSGITLDKLLNLAEDGFTLTII